MKQLILTILLLAIVAVSNAKDVTITGYFLHAKNAQIEVYQEGKVISSKQTVFSHYRIKLQPGKYMILFHSEGKYKRLYITVTTKHTIKVDIDFSNEDNAVLTQRYSTVDYKIIKE